MPGNGPVAKLAPGNPLAPEPRGEATKAEPPKNRPWTHLHRGHDKSAADEFEHHFADASQPLPGRVVDLAVKDVAAESKLAGGRRLLVRAADRCTVFAERSDGLPADPVPIDDHGGDGRGGGIRDEGEIAHASAARSALVLDPAAETVGQEHPGRVNHASARDPLAQM
jgi:hypothetical protein